MGDLSFLDLVLSLVNFEVARKLLIFRVESSYLGFILLNLKHGYINVVFELLAPLRPAFELLAPLSSHV